MLKRTPLFEVHQKFGAKLVEFGGWEMPVQYTSITDEHLAVRQSAGMFDISHMGEVLISGPSALPFLNYVLTNDLEKLGAGQGQYTLMCLEEGGVVDDLYVYRLAEQAFLLIINASRIEADLAWLEKQFAAFEIIPGTEMRNASGEMGAIAVQGPNTVRFIDECLGTGIVGGTRVGRVTELKKNQLTHLDWEGISLWVARTGYTGEDGFEIVAPSGSLEALWLRLFEAGKSHGLKPAGLGARDTLRTEVCYPLYGHELDESTTPIEAGLGFFVALQKPRFIGRAVLASQKEGGVDKKCVAFTMGPGSAPPRPHYPILDGSQVRVGEVVSGTQSPSLRLGIGMGYVPPKYAPAGTPLQIEVRGKLFPATVVAKPIYKHKKPI